MSITIVIAKESVTPETEEITTDIEIEAEIATAAGVVVGVEAMTAIDEAEVRAERGEIGKEKEKGSVKETIAEETDSILLANIDVMKRLDPLPI